ncbi:glutathione S-transferase 1: isoform D-like protein, partial [Dinothrombium tinctorium]
MQYFVNKYAPGNEIYSEDPEKRACIDRMLYFDCGVFAATHIKTLVPLLYEGKFPSDYEINKNMENLRILDGFLAKYGFVTGPTLTLPDITMDAYARTMQVYDVEIFNFKNIARWFQALEDVLPDFKEINEENSKKRANVVVATLNDYVYAVGGYGGASRGWLSSGTVDNSEDNVQHLLAGAKMLDCVNIVVTCSDFIKSQLHSENALRNYAFVEMFGCADLQNFSLNYIHNNFIHIS